MREQRRPASARRDDRDPTAAATGDGQATPDLSQIEELAAAWLAAENALTAGRTADDGEAAARSLSERYTAAITAATQEELRLAWEAARLRQGEQIMGSAEWMEARRVSELLRAEYLAREAS